MKLNELRFDYPEDLVATEPRRPSRVLWSPSEAQTEEISWPEFLRKIPAQDVLVLNNTQVVKRRVFAEDELEILFLDSADSIHWQVLFPAKKYKVGEKIKLPGDVEMVLLEKGRPQSVRTSKPLDESYFEKMGEIPLPPYIQKARGERHNVAEDSSWYQTAWAEKPGSFAAPTASLHFSAEDIQFLKSVGVQVLEITLHVGLGTFLPVTTDNLDDHSMHEEFVEIPLVVWQAVKTAKARGQKIWALGTTTTRALESVALFEQGPSDLKMTRGSHSITGLTRILIQPGYQWKVVDRLLTNFHQPESTLLALVAGFTHLDRVKRAYAWAIERKFRLFSYGDLSVWFRESESTLSE